MATPLELQKKWGLTPHAALHLSRLLDAHPGAVVTSGRRSPERNRSVGGSPRSFHLSGRAADVFVPRRDVRRFIRAAKAQRVTPNCTGPEEVIDEGDHVHLAW